MAEIIGVRFKKGGKIYYFRPNQEQIEVGSYVVVDTARGMECGEVVMDNRDINDKEFNREVKPIIRKATKEDLARIEENKRKAKRAFDICNQKIKAHGLAMNLLEVEYTFDGSKIVFNFSAEGRVDFRELVKDLAGVFRARIELRQIGVRDEAKMLGGLGVCGRPFCCKQFMGDFQSVSIKMAKEQGLSLNPVKISGTCGRLMCCLKHEQDTYEALMKMLPAVGATVTTPDGEGVVTERELVAGRVKVRMNANPEAAPKVYKMVELDDGSFRFSRNDVESFEAAAGYGNFGDSYADPSAVAALEAAERGEEDSGRPSSEQRRPRGDRSAKNGRRDNRGSGEPPARGGDSRKGGGQRNELSGETRKGSKPNSQNRRDGDEYHSKSQNQNKGGSARSKYGKGRPRPPKKNDGGVRGTRQGEQQE